MVEFALQSLLPLPACATGWPVPMRKSDRLSQKFEGLINLARNVSELTFLLPARAHHLCGQVAIDHDPYAAHPGVPSPTSDT